MSKHTYTLTHLILAVAAVGLLLSATGCQGLMMGYTEPEWTSVTTYNGTTFITDGTIAIELELADVGTPPTTESSPNWFGDSIRLNGTAERRELFPLKDIRESADPTIVDAPANIKLAEKYVSYIGGKIAPSHRVGFWQHSQGKPLVIVVDGRAAGALRVLE